MLDRRIRHLGSIVTCICVGVIGVFLLVGWVSSVAGAPQAPGVELGPDHTQQLNVRQTITYSHALTDTGLMTIYLPLVSKGGLEDVYVLSSSVFKDLWGDLHVVGEVLNNTSNNVNGIEINVTFYNSTGGVVGTASTYAFIGGWSWDPPLVPSQKSPFHIELWDPPTDWSSYRFVVVYEIADESPLTGLQVVNVTTRDDGESYHIYGEIRNNASDSFRSVEAVATLYDANGKVINVGASGANPSGLPPGERDSFHLSFSENLADLASYALQPYGSRSSSPVLANLPIPGSDVFEDSWGDLHVVGEVLNNTSNNVNGIEINVTFYNSTGGVVGTASTCAYIGGWSWDPPLVPSRKSPFHIELWDPPTDWSSYRFVVVYEVADESPLTGLQVVNVTTHYDSYGRYHVLGEVENNEAVTVSSVEAIIALYDDTGLVINCGSEYTNPSILTPGQKGAFDISFSDNLSSLSSYVAQATGDPQ
jgi:hypothetical protein